MRCAAPITLTQEGRTKLTQLARSRTVSVRSALRAQMLRAVRLDGGLDTPHPDRRRGRRPIRSPGRVLALRRSPICQGRVRRQKHPKPSG